MTTAERPGRLQLRSGDRIAIVAGSGRLPVDLAQSLAAHGHRPFVVLVRGEASPELASCDHEDLTVENFAGLAPLLKRRGITHVVFAGGISRRPKLGALKPSLALLKFLPRALAALAKGDDGMLRALAAAVDVIGPSDASKSGAIWCAPTTLTPSASTVPASARNMPSSPLARAASERGRNLSRARLGFSAPSFGRRDMPPAKTTCVMPCRFSSGASPAKFSTVRSS